MTSSTRDIALPRTNPLPWPARLARRKIFERIAALARGRLVIEDAEGTWRFGSANAREELVAHVQVTDPAFYNELASGGSIGAAESWVRGQWKSPDLLKVMQLMAANIDLLNGLDDRSGVLERVAARALHLLNRNSVNGSRRNIEAHYDLGNEMFALFLDPTMMYSAAIFPHRDATLEEASLAKLERICRKLELGPGDHLLEIGTGWGGMAEYAARRSGCRVTTTTISRRQYDYARQRIAAAGLEDRVTVLLKDYRELEGQYDKLVSIEMIEAVGHRYLPQYFAACSALLKPHGLMLLQSILMPDQRYTRARRNVDFIQRYIFPGGFLPSTGAIATLTGSHTDMQLIDTLDITPHYADTLAAWRRNFHAGAAAIRALGYGEDFLRLWDYYFCYCEGGFRERAIGTAQFLLAKPMYRPGAA
jgi:cyclopropane-fatty-acyl-phospholipid synthase